MLQPIEQRERKHEAATGAGDPEAAPLPVVVFAAQEEIDDQDRNRGARHHHQAVREEKEAKHVVDFALPYAVHYKVELAGCGTESEHASDEHAWQRTDKASTSGYLTWDLIRMHGWMNGLLWSVHELQAL